MSGSEAQWEPTADPDPEFATPAKAILRSQCLRDCCPFGKGIYFKSRISPSPSKRGIRNRRNRRSVISEAEVVENTVLPNHIGMNHHTQFDSPRNRTENEMMIDRQELRKVRKRFIFTPSLSPIRPTVTSYSERGEGLTSDYFSGSDTPAKLNESTSRLNLEKSQSEYIAYSSDEELESWWQEPKTDYTYSCSLSYRPRVTPDRVITSPNMSRRGIKGLSNGILISAPFSVADPTLPSAAGAPNTKFRSRNVARSSLDGFSDDSDLDLDSSVSTRTRASKRMSQSRVFTKSQMTTRRIQYGLDSSDAENESDSSLSHVAKPLVRRGRTSLLRSVDDHVPINHITTNQIYERKEYLLEGGATRYHTESLQQNKLSLWLRSSWMIIKLIASYVWMPILLCVYALEKLKIYSGNFINQRSKSLQLSSKKRRSAYVETTVISKTRRVSIMWEKWYGWYREQRARNPILFGWLPLLLLILLLFLPLCALWWRTSSESTENSSLYHTLELSSVINGVSSILTWPYHFSRYAATALWNLTLFIWAWLMHLLQTVFGVVVLGAELVSAAFHSLYSWVLSIVVFPLNLKEMTEAATLSSWYDSFYAFGVSLVNFGYDTLSSLADGFVALCSIVWHSLHYVFTYALTLVSTVWSFLVLILSAIWSKSTTAASTVFGVFPSLKSQDTVIFLSGEKGETIDVSSFLKNSLLQETITLSLEKALLERGISKDDIESLVSARVANEVKVILSSMQHPETKAASQLLTIQNELKMLKDQQQSLLLKLEAMETILNMMKKSGDEKLKDVTLAFEQSVTKVTDDLDKLMQQMDSLKTEHEALTLEIRSCCKSTPLSSKDIETHVAMVLSDSFRLPEQDGSRIRSLLRSHFIDKNEFETKLHDFTDTALKFGTEKYNEETMLQMVEQVIGNIRKEILSQNEEDRKNLNESMRMTIDIEKLSLRESLERDKKEMSETVGAALENMFISGIPDHIASKITGEMDVALKKLLLLALQEQLDDAGDSKISQGIGQLIKNKVEEVIRQQLLNDSRSTFNLGYTSVSIGSSSRHPDILRTTEGTGSPFLVGDGGLTPEFEAEILRIIKEALMRYDADKTGMVDHALETAGGSVVSTRCTEAYEVYHAALTIFGYPIFRYSTNTPRSIIQPERMPGQCYAFKGSQGFIVIQFAGPVKVTAFSLEHIPKALTPAGRIDSAPRNFSVSGLMTPAEEGHPFGSYAYEDNDEPLQYFAVKNYTEQYFNYVELKVLSNHGNGNYTCLYRFRVHGHRKF